MSPRARRLSVGVVAAAVAASVGSPSRASEPEPPSPPPSSPTLPPLWLDAVGPPPTTTTPPEEEVTIPPPPPGLGLKRALRGDDYLRKNQGGYVTGLPIANYDPTTGVGFGARGYYYDNGHRSDPFFAYTPYRSRTIAQVFLTTKGAQDHLLDFDAPNFLGSLFRARATLEYEAANVWPYFGDGTRTLAPLSFPGAPGVTYAHASDFDRALQKVQPNGTTYGLYDSIGVQRPTLQLGVERLLLGGVLRPLVGIGLSYTALHDFTGQQTSATGGGGGSVQAPEAPTHFNLDCAAGRILGCHGGWDNVIRLALSLDTRDFEPDPNDGVYAELSSEIGTQALGSQYDYLRVLLSVRGFYSPIPKVADLVIAVRGLYEVQTAGAPFFSHPWMPFIDDNHDGLGGLRTLRGYAQDRFIGAMIVLTNYEVRWTFVRFEALKQKIGLMAVPFLDMGRIFDTVKETTFAGWKRSEGAGLRISWNEATIIMVDYGVSEEDTGLYVNFYHIF